MIFQQQKLTLSSNKRSESELVEFSEARSYDNGRATKRLCAVATYYGLAKKRAGKLTVTVVVDREQGQKARERHVVCVNVIEITC